MRKPSIALGKINIVFFTMVTGWTFINEEADYRPQHNDNG